MLHQSHKFKTLNIMIPNPILKPENGKFSQFSFIRFTGGKKENILEISENDDKTANVTLSNNKIIKVSIFTEVEIVGCFPDITGTVYSMSKSSTLDKILRDSYIDISMKQLKARVIAAVKKKLGREFRPWKLTYDFN